MFGCDPNKSVCYRSVTFMAYELHIYKIVRILFGNQHPGE